MANEDCGVFSTDLCSCACLLNGCNPLHKFWKCNYFMHAADPYRTYTSSTRTALSKVLEEWLRLWNFDDTAKEICWETICQVELFDRLGMRHTCCNKQREWPGSDTWQEMKGYCPTKSISDEAETDELMQEDAQSKAQPDLLMNVYRKFRRQHHGPTNEFWESWWTEVDKILPELTPSQRCCTNLINVDHKSSEHADKIRKHKETLMQARAAQERRALEENGYSGLDYIEVVSRHFHSAYLSAPSPSDATLPAADELTMNKEEAYNMKTFHPKFPRKVERRFEFSTSTKRTRFGPI